jgi:phosphoesterase RecJ-like protein
MKEKIWNKIMDSNSILLLTHENPDGDAIGSVMALYEVLKSYDKKVTAVIPVVPPVFDYLDSISETKRKANESFDLAIVVDCAKLDRVGQTNKEFEHASFSINIDHHATNSSFADLNYIEGDVSSCCQVLYYLFKDWKCQLNTIVGNALVTGMLTDTNGFSNNDVDKKTFLMAADMTDLNVNINKICYLALSKKNTAQHLLMKMALDRLEFFDDGKIAFTYVSKEDLDNVGAKPGDHEGLVNLGRNIEGVEVSVFMREDDGYKISLRSTGAVDVSKVAVKFNGGGHKAAAGIKIYGEFKETKNAVIDEIIKEINSNERDSDNQQKIRIHK